MKVKKFFVLLISFILVFAMFSTHAYAAETAVVYGNATSTKPNSVFFVPVEIKNNPGIMGFKITVSYDPDILSLPAVTRGTVTESGMLNDSAGASEAGMLDIVWTNNSAVANDGTVFVLSFNVDEVEAESTELKLTYSQADTFNEQYEDVKFECKNIVVNFSGEDVTDIYSGEIKEPDHDDIIVAVDSTIKEMPFDSINEIDRDFDEEFIESTNDTVYIMTGTKDYFASVDEIIGAYKAAVATDFVNESCDAVDPEVIDDVIDNALTNTGASSIDNIPDEKKSEFVAEVEEKLLEQAKDINSGFDALSKDEAVEAIKALQTTNRTNQSAGIKIADAVKKTDNLLLKIIIVAVTAVILAFAVIALVIRKKQKKFEEVKTSEKDS